MILGSLSSDVFERRTLTGNGLFALLSRDLEQIFGQIVSIRIKTLGNRVFSHDVMAAILVSQNNETAAMMVSQTNPVGVELFSYANASFVPINLHRCWSRE